jgi:uncharacterized protein
VLFNMKKISERNDCRSERVGKSSLWRALALLGLPMLIGPLLAPYVFNILLWLGRRFEALESLRELEFESVLTRCMLLALLWPALRVLKRSGLRLLPEGLRQRPAKLLPGLLIGLASMATVPLAGLAFGAYRLAEIANPALLPLDILGVLAAALVVGVLEEFIFRALIFGIMDRLLGLWPAALFSALAYSLVHFLHPVLPAGVVHGHWYSGFQTLWVAAISFAQMGVHIFPYSLTLFLIGVSLALIYKRSGSLFLVAGIHAGWILAIKLSKDLLVNTGEHSAFFGADMILSKSYVVAVVALVFLLGLLLYRRAVDRRAQA